MKQINAFAAAGLAATLGLGPLNPSTAFATSDALPPARVQTLDAEQLIEQLVLDIRSAKKPLPVWAVDLAMRAYGTWKTYKNGEKVEDVRREVLAILRVVAEIKADVEAGREMTDREYRRTRELMDVQISNLDRLAGRVLILEWRFFRRCGYGHAWRNGACVDAIANPR